MGYNATESLIYANKETLSSIAEAVKENKEIRFEIIPRSDLGREQYRLRRILAATDYFPTAHGGDFAGLAPLVRISVDTKLGHLVVRPRALSSKSAEFTPQPVKPNERVALAALPSTGSLYVLEFWPSESFSVEWLTSKLQEQGWDLLLPSMMAEENGRISVAVERIEKDSFFGAL